MQYDATIPLNSVQTYDLVFNQELWHPQYEFTDRTSGSGSLGLVYIGPIIH